MKTAGIGRSQNLEQDGGNICMIGSHIHINGGLEWKWSG